jgi:hypothetical protein
VIKDHSTENSVRSEEMREVWWLGDVDVDVDGDKPFRGLLKKALINHRGKIGVGHWGRG